MKRCGHGSPLCDLIGCSFDGGSNSSSNTEFLSFPYKQAQDKAPASLDPAVLERKQREAEEVRLAELRAHGTPVTSEAFRQWQEAFEAEHGLETAFLAEDQRMTGKRYFQLQESRHADVDETPSGSDEEGWDALAERDGIDYDEDDDSSDEEFLLDQLAADRGET